MLAELLRTGLPPGRQAPDFELPTTTGTRMRLSDLRGHRELIEEVRPAMRPGATVGDLDDLATGARARHGLAEFGVYGIGHGIGLRFEELPASTIIPAHRNFPLQEGMTVTIGHPVLAIPGFGGVRFEDVYRVTPSGVEILWPYPILPDLVG